MSQTITSNALCDMLASSLGQDQAARAVSDAVNRHRLRGQALSQRDCEQILDDLGGQSGLVGVVARFAKARVPFMFTDSSTSEPTRRPSIGLSRPPKERRPSGAWPTMGRDAGSSTTMRVGVIGLEQLIDMFADGLDRGVAETLVKTAVSRSQLNGKAFFNDNETAALLNNITDSRYRTDVILVRTRLGSVFGHDI